MRGARSSRASLGLAWLVLALGGCERGPAREVTAPSATRTVDAHEPERLATPAPDADRGAAPIPPDAAPPPVPIPAELESAPAWIGRQFRTGAIRPNHTLETMTLQRAGTTALLTIDLQTAKSRMMERGPWSPKTTRRLLGTVTERGQHVDLRVANVADASDALALSCVRGKLGVAPADAVRVPTSREMECGDEGRWSKPARKIDAILCSPQTDGPSNLDEATWPGSPHIAFAPSPGIEWLHVNDDCFQGAGWRRIPADGGVHAPVR